MTENEKPLVEDPEQDPVAHAEYLENIRKSYARYGPIRPAIVSRFGIIAGAGRKEAIPEWPEVDRKKTDERIKTKFDAYALAAMDNIHEQKSAAWWRKLIGKAAEEIEAGGVPTEEVCQAMIASFPLGEATIRRYIDPKYKMQVRQEAGRKSAQVRREKKAEEHPDDMVYGSAKDAPDLPAQQTEEVKKVLVGTLNITVPLQVALDVLGAVGSAGIVKSVNLSIDYDLSGLPPKKRKEISEAIAKMEETSAMVANP